MFNYNNIDNIQICMDVPFMDHPYLIGPRGRKCQHLMDRYRSLIHFPDSNRRVNGPKLNNVVINGSSKNAEELRSQIRSRTPVRLTVQLSEFADPASLCSRMESAIAGRSLPIRLNYTEDYKSAMLKTEWRNEETLVAFCNEFFYTESYGLFAGCDYGATSYGVTGAINSFEAIKSEDGGLFTMALTILPIVNPWNSELSAQLIEHIHSVTDCWVLYPPKEKFCEQPPLYFIKGTSAGGVLKAGKFMMGLTMFQVSFVVPNTVQLNLEHVGEWQRELLVHTTIEPVFGAGNEVGGGGAVEFLHNRAVLRSFEFCLNSVYFVRSLLLGFKKTVQSLHYNFMSDVKRLIPYSIFSTGQLYFPLYAIDNERSFNFEAAGKDFFQKFYGGPYSPVVTKKRQGTPIALKSNASNIHNKENNNNKDGFPNDSLNTTADVGTPNTSPPATTPTRLYQRWSRLSQTQPPPGFFHVDATASPQQPQPCDVYDGRETLQQQPNFQQSSLHYDQMFGLSGMLNPTMMPAAYNPALPPPHSQPFYYCDDQQQQAMPPPQIFPSYYEVPPPSWNAGVPSFFYLC